MGLCALAILSAAGTSAWALAGDINYEIEGTVVVGLMAQEELNLLAPGAAITGDLVIFGPDLDGELGGTVNIEYAIIKGHISVFPVANVTIKGKKFAVTGGGVLDDPTNPTSVNFKKGPGTLTVTYANGAITTLKFTYACQAIHLKTVGANSVTALLQELIETVAEMNLPNGIGRSLHAKLEGALKALADGKANNDVSAINRLNAFINEVEAQRDKKITEEQATALVGKAQAIVDLLNGS